MSSVRLACCVNARRLLKARLAESISAYPDRSGAVSAGRRAAASWPSGVLAGLASACDTGRSTFSGRLPQPASTTASSSNGSHASQRGVVCGRANGAGWNMAAAG